MTTMFVGQMNPVYLSLKGGIIPVLTIRKDHPCLTLTGS